MTARFYGQAAVVGIVFELVRRDIRTRFVGARFGLLWSVLNPAIQLGSYSLIFGFLYAGPVTSGDVPFVASLFCGLWPWWGFQEGVTRGMTSLVDQAPLLRKVAMPPAACVAAAVTASLLLQLVGFGLFLTIFGLAGVIPPQVTWALLPGVILVGWLLALGAALLLAPLYLFVRDTLHVVMALLTIGFFLSPVLYATDWLPAAVQPLAALNPMTGLLGLYRTTVLGADTPPPGALLVLGLVTTGCVAVGYVVFARLERLFDEYW